MEPGKTPVSEEQELRLKELRLKVKELERPGYLRLNFWTSTLAIFIALGGVVGQNILSGIKSERANLALDKVQKERDSIDSIVLAAKDNFTHLKLATDSLNQDLIARQQQIDTTNKQLVAIQNRIASSGLPPEKRAEINNLLNQTQTDLNKPIQRVYIQIASEDQRETAGKLASALKAAQFRPQGIENVGQKATMPPRAEVRYYQDQDKEAAFKVLGIMKQTGLSINDTPLKIHGKGPGTAGNYEIWFSKN